MKAKKILFLLIAVLAAVSIFASCASNGQPDARQPVAAHAPIQGPPIVTTSFEVSGIEEEGTLKIKFHRASGKCKSLVVNGVEADCDDPRYAIPLNETYFCSQPDADHPANTKVYNLANGDSEEVYCGNVLYLSEGTDIRFKADATAGNRICRVIGGVLRCF
jgi:hypothetical protein